MPDNQEVFADAQTDQCVIVELLQRESNVRDVDSARFFFNEVASANGCAPADVEERHAELLRTADAPVLSADNRADAAVVSVLVGDQRVSKFREGDDAKNVVRVFLANIRCVWSGETLRFLFVWVFGGREAVGRVRGGWIGALQYYHVLTVYGLCCFQLYRSRLLSLRRAVSKTGDCRDRRGAHRVGAAPDQPGEQQCRELPVRQQR